MDVLSRHLPPRDLALVVVVDLAQWISGRGGVFAALQDQDFFAQVRVDADAGTIVWPNGVDLDPDMLYDAAQRPTHTRA